MPEIDLEQLAIRESEQVEWKKNVADIDDVVETLCAFANDLANLGGGYVVCGAEEARDEHGFPTLIRTGLQANRLKEVENRVLAQCRDRIAPSIGPLTSELAGQTPDRRILVFVQPATSTSHTFRRGTGGARHYVRIGRSTVEARNGILRDLLVRKGVLEPWDRRPCPAATDRDLDLLALRDTLNRMGVLSSDRYIEAHIYENQPFSPFVPSLCVREPLTNAVRPRNFAMLLFGRDVQRFVPGAFSLFSIYPGKDRSDLHAERHELAGTLIEQAQRLRELLDVQSYIAFDKDDPNAPNALKYPRRALYEAMGNALAHRDYEAADPTRVTVFDDRIEVVSPGSLPLGVDPQAFREGRSGPKWRNQALAWFFNRLQLAQAEGQGIPTILRTMREEGCPPPAFETTGVSVICVLPAHPRHALLRDLREIEHDVTVGALRRAQDRVRGLLERDTFNYRAIRLFAEVQRALRDVGPIWDFVMRHEARILAMPSDVLVQLSEALVSGDRPPEAYRETSRKLLAAAAWGRLEERELRRVAVAMMRAGDGQGVLSLIADQLRMHPALRDSASAHQLRGDAMLELAKRCRFMARRPNVARETRERAWRQFHDYLRDAEQELKVAGSLAPDAELARIIELNQAYLERLRRENQPPVRRHGAGQPDRSSP